MRPACAGVLCHMVERARRWYGHTLHDQDEETMSMCPDSSLSACTEAVLAAEVGHLRLAFDYAAEAALLDLLDFEHNTRDGLHIASLAEAWIALVVGLGGMRDSGETLSASLSKTSTTWILPSRRSTSTAGSLLRGPPLATPQHGRAS